MYKLYQPKFARRLEKARTGLRIAGVPRRRKPKRRVKHNRLKRSKK